MKCTYCNNEIPAGQEVEFGGQYFCNTLHRYSWQDNALHSKEPVVLRKQGKITKIPETHKKSSFATFAVIIIVVIAITGGAYLRYILRHQGSSVEDQLRQSASTVSLMLPKMVDEETRLDSIVAPGDKSLTYYLTLINTSGDGLDFSQAETKVKPAIVQNIKANPMTKQLAGLDVSFRYRYYDKNGKYLTEIAVTSADYK